MIRAFIAVEIDQPLKQKISELISKLKKSDTNIKWVNENQIHFTLKFLGNIEESKVQAISAVLKSIASHSKEFALTLSDIGAFPNMKRPRVIWIGVDKGADNLKILADKIEIELEKLGFEKEKREFKSHLTLGRVRSLKNRKNRDSDHFLKMQKWSLSLGEIKIDKLILFQSTLTPKGATYTQLVAAELVRLGG